MRRLPAALGLLLGMAGPALASAMPSPGAVGRGRRGRIRAKGENLPRGYPGAKVARAFARGRAARCC